MEKAVDGKIAQAAEQVDGCNLAGREPISQIAQFIRDLITLHNLAWEQVPFPLYKIKRVVVLVVKHNRRCLKIAAKRQHGQQIDKMDMHLVQAGFWPFQDLVIGEQLDLVGDLVGL